MKKAFDWLEAQEADYSFHDYKKHGISKEKLNEWLTKLEVTQLINTKGVTFKKLTEAEKISINNKLAAINLMMEKPSMIKRPLVETEKGIVLGFNAEEWDTQLR